MAQPKIGSLLQALTEQEIREFRKFIASPYFHSSTQFGDLNALAVFLYQNGANTDDFSKEKAFSVCFPGQTFAHSKLEKALSTLHQLLKRFISLQQQEIAGWEFEALLNQLVFYRERGLTNRFQNLLAQMNTHESITGPGNEFTFKRKFALDYEIFHFELTYHSKKAYSHIPDTLKSLESAYLLSKLELINQYLIAQKITKFKVDQTPPFEIDNAFSLQVIETSPILKIAFNISILLKKDAPTVSDFNFLQQLINEHEGAFDAAFNKMFLTYLRNYCALLVYENQENFLPVLFQLSKTHYELGYLHYDQRIPGSTLVGVTQTALMVKEIKWASQFIEAHKGRIIGETPENDYYHLAKSNLLFYQQKFEKALDLLPAGMQTIDLNLLCKRIELKCLFKMNSPILESKIDTFRMLISRAGKDILPEQQRKRNSAFVNMLHRILSTPPMDKKKIEKLRQQLLEEKEVADRLWLLECLDHRKP